MKIRAKTFLKYATDGIGHNVRVMQCGDVADIADYLAAGYISEGMAEECIEEKKIVSAPENKAIEAAPKNKRGVKK